MKHKRSLSWYFGMAFGDPSMMADVNAPGLPKGGNIWHYLAMWVIIALVVASTGYVVWGFVQMASQYISGRGGALAREGRSTTDDPEPVVRAFARDVPGAWRVTVKGHRGQDPAAGELRLIVMNPLETQPQTCLFARSKSRMGFERGLPRFRP